MISSAVFAKSSTNVSCLPGRVRLSRDSVCTAFTPASFLSTYIVCSSGSSNPVWYFSATTRNFASSSSLNRLGSCDSAKPLIDASVSTTSGASSSVTVPENATSARSGRAPVS